MDIDEKLKQEQLEYYKRMNEEYQKEKALQELADKQREKVWKIGKTIIIVTVLFIALTTSCSVISQIIMLKT